MGKKLLMSCILLVLVLSACSGNAPAKSSTSSSSNDLGSALNLLLGSDSEPSVFSSYHIDVNLDTPQANDDNTAVVNQNTLISADVAGKDVHILQTDPGATAQKEGFIIGDKEYKMVDGAPQENDGANRALLGNVAVASRGELCLPRLLGQKDRHGYR